ncbi:MAG TPA: hypothetical protein VGQ64_06945 [Candidatus Limnocylindrales bacterium]|jgi:hypothetical protein|nr:hypothetical protein [Candidatus Limnocylindrales bacterium]
MRHTTTFRRVLICTLALMPVACSAAVVGSPGPSGSSNPNATAQASAAAARPPDAWLVVGRRGEAGVEVVQARTGEREYELPLGAPTDSKWGELVVATSDGGQTTVKSLVVQPGFGGGTRVVDGRWRLPTIGDDPVPVGVSFDGSTVVLVEDTDNSARSTSRFLVLDRSSMFLNSPHPATAQVIELAGSFEFDALSPNGRVLYVVEHLSTGPAGHYQVRAVDLPAGTLRPEVIVDKRKIGEEMAGWPISQLRAPDGVVYTLYRGAEHPFVHALQSADGFAVCIDLPLGDRGLEEDRVIDWGLAASPDWKSVYAANATVGQVVDIDPGELAIRHSATIKPIAQDPIVLAKFGHSEGGPIGRRVVVSADGRMAYAAGAEGIVAIKTGDLSVAARYPSDSAVKALGLTPDGATLFALLGDGGRIVAFDTTTGKVVGEVAGSGYDRLLAVMPW